jgi:hypothetical protein
MVNGVRSMLALMRETLAPDRGWRPSAIGRRGPLEGVIFRGDRATENGGAFRSGSHSIIFKPPSLLPPRSFPPLASTLDARAAVAFTSEQNAARYLPAHRIC